MITWRELCQALNLCYYYEKVEIAPSPQKYLRHLKAWETTLSEVFPVLKFGFIKFLKNFWEINHHGEWFQ